MKLIVVIAVALLSACGGQSEPARKQVSFYGDSITSGASNTGVDGVFNWLTPSPVQVMSAKGNFIGVDYSMPGATVLDVQNGKAGLKFPTFIEAIANDTSDIVFIRYATASALKMSGQCTVYEAALQVFVQQAKAAGKTVVLTGSPVVDGPFSQKDLAEFEAATEAVAKRNGVLFIRLLDIPNPSTSDGLHPDRAYSDAISAEIVSKL